MHSIKTTVFSLILFICCAHCLSATRIPMEIVEVTSTQVTSDEKKLNNRHKTSISDVIDSTSSSSSISNSNSGHSRTDDHTEHSHSTSATTNTHQIIEQRKGRQIVETTVHTPRILYQVGVS